MFKTKHVILLYTLLVIRDHWMLSNSFLKGNAVPTFPTRKVRLLRISHSMRMETVYFTLHVSGVMWILSGTSSLMKDVTPMFEILLLKTLNYTVRQSLDEMKQLFDCCHIRNVIQMFRTSIVILLYILQVDRKRQLLSNAI